MSGNELGYDLKWNTGLSEMGNSSSPKTMEGIPRN